MKKGFLMTLALLLVAVGAYFVSGTYARYTDNLTKAGTATVAKWAFSSDNTETTLDIKLGETYDPTTLVAERIAPGTKGYFDIELSNANTETAVDVTVAISKENAPTNLKFYTDEACTSELTATQLTAVIIPKGTLDKKTIYWKWDYNTDANETIDSADTTAGEAAKDMSVTLTITGTQKAPTTNGTVLTSGWN